MENKEFISLEHKILFEKLVSGEISQSSNITALLTDPSISQSQKQVLKRAFTVMERTKIRSSYQPLKVTSGLSGKLIAFGKKVIRKLNFWYVEPICMNQNTFNEAATDLIEQLCEIQNDTLHKIRKLQDRIVELENIISENKRC